MMKMSLYTKTVMIGLVIGLCGISFVFAQSLDGRSFDPEVDPDIDMNIGSWEDSLPKRTHGNLVERDILTRGDPLNPPSKGAVLRYMKRFTYATLGTNDSTNPVTLKKEQEIFYILSGKGVVKAGGKSADLYEGIAVLMPPEVEFTISNTGEDDLTMYLICEPVPDGFKTNTEMKISDENVIPYRTSNGHWSHIVKELFLTKDNLATLQAVLTVTYHPMTIGHPHSHDPDYGSEEVWTAIKGTSIAFIGKQIRMQPPGMAYNIPPDGNTPHSNINNTDKPVKLFYFAVGAGEVRSKKKE
ncbi:cupin domain-containing protein [Candidatus Latescibacterota bacterium]